MNEKVEEIKELITAYYMNNYHAHEEEWIKRCGSLIASHERMEKENEKSDIYIESLEQEADKAYREKNRTQRKLQRIMTCAEKYLEATEGVFMATSDDEKEEKARANLQQTIKDSK